MKDKCRVNSVGKKLLVLCDTTEYNLENHRGRIKDFKGIGATSNNSSLGFFSHNLLAIDRESKCCLGWAEVKLFNRPVQNKPFTRENCTLPIEKKESFKWLEPCIKSKTEVFSESKHVLFVMDREADIYEVMERLPDEKNDVLIRIRHDRIVYNSEVKKVKVLEEIRCCKSRGTVNIKITSDCKKRRARLAQCEIKWANYDIPIGVKVYSKVGYRPSIEMTAVHIMEKPCSVPKGEKPIEWTLWYSQPINNLEEAIEVIECYRTRWLIEEAHRLLKTKGFNIEATELEKGTSIRKLLLLGMDATVKIMQLKSARNGEILLPISQVFNEDEIQCLKTLNENLQGQTEKSKNPFEPNTLPWASWVIARLGGWKGFRSQRPPGTITFKRGFDSFKDIFLGYQMAKGKDMYKR